MKGRTGIQKFHSEIMDSSAIEGFFITTGELTKEAIQYSSNKEIIIYNGDDLLILIN